MRRRGGMGAMTQGRLAFLKAELKITQAQEPAWMEYSDAAKDRVSIMQGMRQGMMESMQNGTAVERMEARIKRHGGNVGIHEGRQAGRRQAVRRSR